VIRHALILAAGRGERMQPLTGHTPKPLLQAGGKRLIEWHLERLAAIGVSDVVINVSHLAEQFPAALGDGSRWNLRISYSLEGPQPLETGGGMLHALERLGDDAFIVANGDIWTDFEVAKLALGSADVAHLVMVDNPAHVPQGDFHLDPQGRIAAQGSPRLTYAGLGVYRPGILAHWQEDLAVAGVNWEGDTPARFALVHVLRAAIRRGEVSGHHHRGIWTDVGTPQRLDELDRLLREQAEPGCLPGRADPG